MSSCLSDGCAQSSSPPRRIRRDLDPNYECNVHANNITKCVYIFDPENPSEERLDAAGTGTGANKMGSKSFNSMSIISPLYSFLYGEEEELARINASNHSCNGSHTSNFMTTPITYNNSRSLFHDILSSNSPFSGDRVGKSSPRLCRVYFFM